MLFLLFLSLKVKRFITISKLVMFYKTKYTFVNPGMYSVYFINAGRKYVVIIFRPTEV